MPSIPLEGRTILVAGGAGVAGECTVQALLHEGVTVVVPSRSEHSLERLRSPLTTDVTKRLHTLVADLGTAAGCERVRETVTERYGPLDGVVVSLGGWWEGQSLTDVSSQTWDRVIHDNLTVHFLMARTFIPLLRDRENSVYLALNGIAAHKPVLNAGLVTVTGVALSMLISNLALEHRSSKIRIHQLSILTPIVTRLWNRGPIEPGWLRGEHVGRAVVSVLSPDFDRPAIVMLSIPTEIKAQWAFTSAL